MYLITNQNNFSKVPYPCPSIPKATVKSGGCGSCSVLNCIENMTTKRFKMADWIDYVMTNGGRIDGGTSISAILKALKRDYGFAYATSNDVNTVKRHLQNGGMAVFHGGYGNILSSAGHFVCLAGVNSAGLAIVIDSGWYRGKYNSSFRRGKVREGSQNGVVYVSFANLEKDKKYKSNQGVNYYLVTAPQGNKENTEDEEMRYKTIKDIPDYGQKAIKKLVEKGYLCGTSNGELNISEDMLRILVILERVGIYEK